jgi:hypothetical protein
MRWIDGTILPLKLGEHLNKAVALQLVPERTVDVAGEPPASDDLASFGDQLFFEGERDFLGGHVGIILRVG